jgi:hypothetical protein
MGGRDGNGMVRFGVLVGCLVAVGSGCTPRETGESGPVVAAAAASATGRPPAPRSIYRVRNPNLAAAAAPAGAHLSYFGGRVVSNIHVVEVIYGAGTYLPQVTSTTAPNIPSFYQGVTNSAYFDWLTEYDTDVQPAPTSNQVIGRGTFVSQVTITPSAANNGATIDDTNIQAELAAQIAAGNLPAPTHDAGGNNNTYYAIFFPHGKVITLQGSQSCVIFCAYHGTVANVPGFGEIYYGVHPDMQTGSGCEGACGNAPTTFGDYTQVASHELIETTTDAEIGLATVFGPPLAWYDQPDNQEIGDLCNDQHATVVGGDGVTYDVQTEFSNVANACIVSRTVTPSLSALPTKFEGGTSSTGTVSLGTVAPAGGTSVTLASSAPSLVTVPSSVLVPAGSVSATFPITSVATSTETTVTVTGTFPGPTTASVTLTILVSPTVASVTVSPTSVVAGTSATGTVTLTGAAPSGGATVALTSSNTSIATVPASVVVPAGATSATFAVTTVVSSLTSTVALSAAYHDSTQSAQLTVTGVAGLASISVSPASLDGGGTATGTVALNNAAPSGGATVTLSSSSPTVASVPASVTVAAGGTTATFTVTTTSVASPTTVTISGTYPSGVTASATLTVNPPGNASFDATLKAPRCTAVGSFCDTGGTLILGRGAMTGGVEPNAPNTIGGTCLDGNSGTFHVDESVDRLRVRTTDGTNLASGKQIQIDATLWAFSTSDFLDLYFAPDATNPVWTLITTVQSPATGQQIVLTTPFTLPAATLPAIRATWRFSGAAATCTTGIFDDHDDLIFAISGTPVNQPPVVNAGPDQTITLPASASLSGTATDDGLPNPPAKLTTTWSTVSGPGTVTFGNASALATTASFSTSGSYVLRLTASDGALSTTDDIAVTVNPAPVNKPPVVNAGPDQTITLPASASLSGTVTDDGLPNPPATVTVTWSKVSGPGTVTFANASASATTASFSTSGSYVLRLTASDSALTASDDIAITVNPAATNKPPVVNAGPDLTITLPASASLNGTVTDDGLPNPPGAVTVTWSKVSGPGTVTFANASAKVTTATFSAAGTYVVQLSASDSALSATDTAQITVNAAGTGPCANLCSNPVNFTISGSFQSGNLGTGAVCYQTTSVVHGGNCGNFVSPRTLKVNGTTEPCTGANWSSVPAARNGGYCIQTTAGNQPWAYITAW